MIVLIAIGLLEFGFLGFIICLELEDIAKAIREKKK
jgi:preprotein translocase subunit Sss1